jgi:hypothetical protein
VASTRLSLTICLSLRRTCFALPISRFIVAMAGPFFAGNEAAVAAERFVC